MKLSDRVGPLEVEPALEAFAELGTTDGATTRVDAEPDPEALNDCVAEKPLTAREPLEVVPICVGEACEEKLAVFDGRLLDGES